MRSSFLVFYKKVGDSINKIDHPETPKKVFKMQDTLPDFVLLGKVRGSA